MPYKLKKVGENQYYVVKKDNENEKFSDHPLPHETALKQMRAIILNENRKKKKKVT